MLSKMPKIRISEITAFVVLAATCGFFCAFVFVILLIMSRNLRYFRFIMPDMFYDEAGEPREMIAKTFPTLLVVNAAALFILFDNVICGILLLAAAVIDIAEAREGCINFAKKMLKR